ncbi:MAG: 4-hydroxythreonine-4-phosphate dehydrogenase PdxA, partial [Planctomycetales bacterium]
MTALPYPVRLALTLGDPTGVGPEVILGAWTKIQAFCRPLVVGRPEILRRAARLLNAPLTIV